ncbi:hypothetical protein ABZ461_27220 [Actinacidiphila glaucinigra]|uniref:hypothetical protein n=1 Tax=Actinacidiphila glaucinigra TaxID=235986 RepID=UPI0033C6723E
MSANKKKLIILGFSALLAIIAAIITWQVFTSNGKSGLDSLLPAGGVLAFGIGVGFGIINAFTFKDDDAPAPPAERRAGASS